MAKLCRGTEIFGLIEIVIDAAATLPTAVGNGGFPVQIPHLLPMCFMDSILLTNFQFVNEMAKLCEVASDISYHNKPSFIKQDSIVVIIHKLCRIFLCIIDNIMRS